MNDTSGAAEFGATVRAARQARHVTQEELAERAGVSVRTVQLIESGRGGRPRPATRRRLLEVLGAPAPAGSPVAASVAPRAVAGAPDVPVPRQLPADVRAFRGRERELAALDGMLDEGVAGAPEMVLATVSGPGGVGKTALAVHWARAVVDRFPDGQLYYDLRGYGSERPTPPEVALGVFLRALGVPGPAVPVDVEDRTAMYRTLLAPRRVLVLLDNVFSADQVRPLLPGADGCVVIVTSRDTLPGLVVRDGARRVDLGLLSPADSVELLRTLIAGVVPVADATLTELARRCGHLPLALRIAAERVVAAPHRPVAALVAELADEQRLDTLDVGDEQTAVRTVLSWSYERLAAGPALAFRRFGLYPGRRPDARALSALLDEPPVEAVAAVTALVRAHLAEEPEPDRWGMHDLLLDFSRELAAGEPEADREAARARLHATVVAQVAAAMDALVPHERDRRPTPPGPPVAVPAFDGPAAARAWLDDRRADLVAVAGSAAEAVDPRPAGLLSTLLWRYLDSGAHHTEALTLHGLALRAATRTRDGLAEATALRLLGVVYSRTARYADATAHLERALARFTAVGDRRGAASALLSLGAVGHQTGRLDDSLRYLERALELFRDLGDVPGEAQTLGNIAGVHFELGDHPLASTYAEQAREAFRGLGDEANEARTTGNLGTLYERLGRLDEALAAHRRTLEVFRATGNILFTGRSLGNLASVHRRLGRPDEAAPLAAEALRLIREVSDREGEADVLAVLAATRLDQGEPAPAAELYAQALVVARTIGDAGRQAGMLVGRAQVWLAVGDHERADADVREALRIAVRTGSRYERARAEELVGAIDWCRGRRGSAFDHWRSSLELFEALGLPDAGRVREVLMGHLGQTGT